MRHSRAIGLVLAACLLASCAGRPFTATKYRPAGPIGGYSEKQIEPGIWRVRGRSNGMAEQGFGKNMAMYRAAEIMKQEGFEKFQIINQNGKIRSMRQGYAGPSSYAGETMELIVVGITTYSVAPPCRADNPKLCFQVEIAPTMQQLAPLLYVTQTQNAEQPE